ncbi:MAG: ABC transporter ATP-binding protein [Acidimicrobiales bacterium]
MSGTVQDAPQTATNGASPEAALDTRPAAIEVVDVTKTFRKHSEPSKTLKERVLTFRRSTTDTFDALSNVRFDVKVGETFGILGHNGSGKSTLLKCVAGTIRPSEGIVRVRGRLSALLELGAGFHPDLTGRENVYLNGSILGFPKARIDEMFDDIVAFAGLEEFIDTQVKHYSSGMYARLGFAVAVNVEPDVLLIDEVLAVGDEAFQRKCIERVRGFQAAGRTICLVTHSPEMVRHLCDRAVVLDHGEMIHLGSVNEAVAIYRRSLAAAGHEIPHDAVADEVAATAVDPDAPPVEILGVGVEPPPRGHLTFEPGDQVTIRGHYRTTAPLPVRARLILHTADGMQLLNISSYDLNAADLGPTDGEGTFSFVIDDLPFADGTYLITLVLQRPDETAEYARHQQKISFEVGTGGVVYGPVAMDVSFVPGD